MSFAPLAVTLGKGGEAHASHTVHMPKGCGKVHPLLAAILTDRAVEQVVDTGIGLIQEGDEVVFHHRFSLGVQALLPIQRFQLHTNRVHRSMLAQFRPVVKPIASNLPGICLVSLYFAQGVVPVILDEFRIDRADKDALLREKAGHWLIVPPGVLHDHPCLTVQAFQVVCQLLEFTAGVTNSKWLCHHFPKGTENRYHALSFGNIYPCHIVHVQRSSSWICLLASSHFIIAYPIYLMTRAHRCGSSTCINRTLRMRGWLTDLKSDATVLGGEHQTKTLSF